MAKGGTKSVFFCNECGYESSKWVGQCPACKAWNTMTEEKVQKSGTTKSIRRASDSVPVSMDEISLEDEKRFLTGMAELDRVLGGGIVPGSLTLVGGDPGIGKSTLLLQVCRNLSNSGIEVLYISGEESLKQIKLRANRIGDMGSHLKLLCETNLENICETVRRGSVTVAVIDSIQTMYSEALDAAAGSVSQVREATSALLRLAKEHNVSVFIVGHVTKEGTVAGPRVLEHMVDTVLYFEGDRHASYRILRGVKNRFGSTNEMGVFEMKNEGLVEVPNPSEYMLAGRPVDASGAIVSCAIEGTRPILIELQALVTRSGFGIPRRQSTGSDTGRLNLLMAVLEKRLDLKIGDHDAYVNIAGGLKIQEPAIDLAVVLAVVSSFREKSIDSDTVAFGEVGLCGEVRSVTNAQIRVAEAKKLGFKRVILPATNLNSIDEKGIKLIGVSSIEEALEEL